MLFNRSIRFYITIYFSQILFFQLVNTYYFVSAFDVKWCAKNLIKIFFYRPVFIAVSKNVINQS